MSPQRNLSNFVDTILLTYVLSNDADIHNIQKSIIDDYKTLNEKCDNIILKIKNRKKNSRSHKEVEQPP